MRVLLLIILCLGITAGGCAWVGETTGKAQAKLERKANAVERGYKDGYNKEKSKQ